jgi:segregation and condensation protein A
MEIHVKLPAFEGPFDLLFHLIEKKQINIYDIPIAELTDQYVAIVKSFPPDMEFISEFILMAATLVEIKSRMLLPKPQKDAESGDPRENLVQRLLEYKRFKAIAQALRPLEAEGAKRLYRQQEQTVFELLRNKKTVNLSELCKDLTWERLIAVYRDVLERRELRTDKVRAAFSAIPKDIYTVEDKIEYLSRLLDRTPQMGFLGLLTACKDKSEKVTTFLALLELIKDNSVQVRQEGVFEDIIIDHREVKADH